ncbi:MAG: GIY-YIG nuclease family protein [bacterium]|nr:GIY-YIG nuclease family protein [bacterium]
MFYVYILKSIKDSDFYTGSTDDLKKRFLEHNNGLVKSTKMRRPFKLVYYEAYSAEQDARLREARLKQRSRALAQLKGRIMNSLKT